MNGPDGYEERTQWYDETYERELDEINLSDQLADESYGAILGDPL